MLMIKLQEDSRGVIISFNSMCYAIGILSVYRIMPFIQSLYGDDYGKGGSMIFFFFYFCLSFYWVVLTLYVFWDSIRRCINKKKNNG